MQETYETKYFERDENGGWVYKWKKYAARLPLHSQSVSFEPSKTNIVYSFAPASSRSPWTSWISGRSTRRAASSAPGRSEAPSHLAATAASPRRHELVRLPPAAAHPLVYIFAPTSVSLLCALIRELFAFTRSQQQQQLQLET
jgi:hypothetical protein